MCIYIHVYIWLQVYKYITLYAYIFIYMNICTYINVNMYTYVHIYIYLITVEGSTLICIYTYIYVLHANMYWCHAWNCIFKQIHVCLRYIYTNTKQRMHPCLSITMNTDDIYIYIYIYMYRHMYMYTNAELLYIHIYNTNDTWMHVSIIVHRCSI
jgi:hypothetical protein